MRYGVIGHSGRMGRALAAAFRAEGHELVLSVDENGGDFLDEPQVIVDFSRPGALATTLGLCEKYGAALVLGTTGLSAGQLEGVDEFAQSCPVVQSANFCPGINLLAMILGDYGDMLSGWTMEIVEAHHDGKVDAPSGTALMLMESAGRGCPIHSLRMGNLPGDHTAVFSNGDELLTLSHRTVNRSIFAQGALRAAEFSVIAPPGRYTFQDVLRSGAGRRREAARV